MRANRKYRAQIKDFIKRRDAAVLAAVRDNNIEPMREFVKLEGIEPGADRALYATAHKYCCNICNMPACLKAKSKIWLEENGFKY